MTKRGASDIFLFSFGCGTVRLPHLHHHDPVRHHVAGCEERLWPRCSQDATCCIRSIHVQGPCSPPYSWLLASRGRQAFFGRGATPQSSSSSPSSPGSASPFLPVVRSQGQPIWGGSKPFCVLRPLERGRDAPSGKLAPPLCGVSVYCSTGGLTATGNVDVESGGDVSGERAGAPASAGRVNWVGQFVCGDAWCRTKLCLARPRWLLCRDCDPLPSTGQPSTWRHRPFRWDGRC